MSGEKTKLSVLISGSGTNLQSIIDACNNNTIPNACIVRVTSNRKAAYGLERAQKAGIPIRYHNLLQYKKQHPANVDLAREEYDKALAELLLADKPDLVVCAGFMHVLSESFLKPLAEVKVPIINLHPALPGHYNGAGAIERAHEDWRRGKIEKTGIMIHYVIADVDMGEPLIVQEIPFIESDEDVQELEQRIHEREWKLIVQGINIAISRLPRPTESKHP